LIESAPPAVGPIRRTVTPWLEHPLTDNGLALRTLIVDTSTAG
jgi:hypothetical protein